MDELNNAIGSDSITEPAPQNVRIRLRVDGELAPYLELPARFRRVACRVVRSAA